MRTGYLMEFSSQALGKPIGNHYRQLEGLRFCRDGLATNEACSWIGNAGDLDRRGRYSSGDRNQLDAGLSTSSVG